MTTEIYMNPDDVEIIKRIIEENDIKTGFKILFDNSSGIGYNLDLEFSTEVNGREATIRIPITGVENW